MLYHIRLVHEKRRDHQCSICEKNYERKSTLNIHIKTVHENKYEFPPPVDSALYFGRCLLVNPSGDLTIEMWNEFYEGIMQFEDMEDTEEEEEDMPEGEYTNGYLKDGFVVSDNELEEEPYNLPIV